MRTAVTHKLHDNSNGIKSTVSHDQAAICPLPAHLALPSCRTLEYAQPEPIGPLDEPGDVLANGMSKPPAEAATIERAEQRMLNVLDDAFAELDGCGTCLRETVDHPKARHLVAALKDAGWKLTLNL